MRVGGAQHLIAAGVESAVVHRKWVIAPLFRLELGGGQQAVGLESVEVDEVGVARKGRAALVGAVAVAGGAEGQQLPDVLARSGQKIHELERFGAKAANTIGPGRLDTGIRIPLSRMMIPSSLYIPFGFLLFPIIT